MIDFAQDVAFNVGDTVQVDGFEESGSIESIRIISEAKLVEKYQGAAKNVVLTIQMGDAVVNKRGMDINTAA